MGRVREYELVLILSPAVDEERSASVIERVDRFITERGGAMTKQEEWGMRRLAYPIQRYNEGNYYLRQFTLDGDHIREMEASLGVAEDILRHMVVKVET